jgi:hypothetical protein
MAETRLKCSGANAPAGQKLPGKKAAQRPLPSLEDITPAHFARLNSLQRRELTLKLIEFLKSI